jgi:hypothetical protein
MDSDRAEHLQWCKDRALEYVELGDSHNAIASMLSDLNRHPHTIPSQTVIDTAMTDFIIRGQLTTQRVTDWINGFT